MTGTAAPKDAIAKKFYKSCFNHDLRPMLSVQPKLRCLSFNNQGIENAYHFLSEF